MRWQIRSNALLLRGKELVLYKFYCLVYLMVNDDDSAVVGFFIFNLVLLFELAMREKENFK